MFYDWFGHHAWMFGSISWWVGILSVLLHFLFWAGIIYLILSLINKACGSNTSETQGKSLAILRERYTKGEITLQEYEKSKEELISSN